MIIKHTRGLVAAACATGMLMGAQLAPAQQGGVFAYPNAGQDQARQSQDRFECHQWSVGQTGFDPSTAPPLPAAAPATPPPNSGYSDQPPAQKKGGFLGLGNGGIFQGGGMVGDAATGAALGAAGGALAGNAGKGAAIGALASTVFGAVSRSSQTNQTPPPQQQQGYDYAQAQYQQQAQVDQAYQERLARTNEYNQAFGACMKARNYTVN